MSRPLAAFLAGCALATLVACATALYTLPRLVVAPPASGAAAPAAYIRAGVPTVLRDTTGGETMLCVSSRGGQVFYPLLHAP